MNARYYNASIGRFISQDPVFLAMGDNNQLKQITGKDQQTILADPQQLNSYSYANNNPIIKSDPTGRWVESAFDLASLSLSINDYRNNPNPANAFFVGADAISLALPIPAFIGYIRHGDKLVDAGKGVVKSTPDILKSLQKPAEALAQREKLLNLATHQEAKNIIDEVFRLKNKYPGGTAGALKIEKQLGVKIGDVLKDHAIKAQNSINRINNKFNDFGKEFDKSTTKVLNDIKKGLERTLKMQ